MVQSAVQRVRLFSESVQGDEPLWRFVVQAHDGSPLLEASDRESGVDGDRLDLLALVRGLEALEEPSRLTLVTPSRYVRRGLSYGLEDWRHNGWRWENFGVMVPIKNADLWQRVDRALSFHEVEGRNFRIDAAHAVPSPAVPVAAGDAPNSVPRPNFLGDRATGAGVRVHRLLSEACQNIGWQLAQFGTPLMKSPWLE
ncbi:MAG: hypothetical protein K8T25_02835 [Planctomycetia bacterium]|nr:hypothetical protein [Planctomycetia bacterium]